MPLPVQLVQYMEAALLALLDDIIDHRVGRILGRLDIEHDFIRRVLNRRLSKGGENIQCYCRYFGVFAE